MPGAIAEAYVEISPDFSGFPQQAKAGVDKAMAGVQSSVDSALAKVTGSIKGAFTTAFQPLERAATSSFTSVENTAQGAFDAVGADAREAGSDADRAFTEVASDAKSSFGIVERESEHAADEEEHDLRRVGDEGEQQFDRIEREAKDASSKAGGHFKGLAVAAGGALAAVGFGTFVKKAVNEAADLGESVNAMSVVLGDKAAASWNTFAEGAASSMGVTQSALNQALVPAASLLANTGLQGEELSGSLQDLAQRAVDTGSVMNKDVNEVLEAMGAAIRGEIEPARALGINFNEAAIEAKALELGLVDSSGAATDAGKTQARLALVMEQSERYAGDFANTADSLPNLLKTLKATGSEAAASLGSALIPALTGLMESFAPIIDAARPVLEMIGTALGQVVAGIAPILAGLMETLGPVLGEVFAILGPALGDAFATLGPALIELTEALAPLIVALVEALVPVLPLLVEGLVAVINAVIPLIPYIVQMVEAITPFVPAILAVLVAVTQIIPALLAMNPVVLAIAGAIGLIVVAFTLFRPQIEQVAAFIMETVVPVLLSFADTIMVAVQGAITWFQSMWPAIQEALGHVQTVIEIALNFIMGIWHAVGDDILNFVGATFAQIGEVIGAAVDIIRNIIELALNIINGNWSAAWHNVLGILRGAWDLIVGVIRGALGQMKAVLGGIVSLFGSMFRPVGNFLHTWIISPIEGVISFISGVPGKISRVASGMFDGIKNAFRGAINFIIDGWNSLEFTIPGFKIGPVGYDGFTLGLPTIPRLARGGYLTSPTVAAIAESGPEVALPVGRQFARNRAIVASAGGVDAILGPGSGGFMVNGGLHITIISPDPLASGRQVEEELRSLQARLLPAR